MTWRRALIWALTGFGWVVCAPFIFLAMAIDAAVEELEAAERGKR
ncbi:hypothetical protein [Citreimonas sp.]